MEIVFGSDEEKAINKAIHNVFPKARHLLCTKHMKDNIRRNLKDKIGCSREEREKNIHSIFGHRGIVSLSDDPMTLNLHLQSLRPFFVKYPPFEKYFKEKNNQNLLEHVIQPINMQIIPGLWTNNNCESINNKLKMQVNWRSQKMPSQISALENIVLRQFRHLKRSLYGFGNYKLSEDFLNFYIPQSS